MKYSKQNLDNNFYIMDLLVHLSSRSFSHAHFIYNVYLNATNIYKYTLSKGSLLKKSYALECVTSFIYIYIYI